MQKPTRGGLKKPIRIGSEPNIQNPTSTRFLTGSSYQGSWNDAIHEMDGFGSYRYPDGSEYRGRFVQGKFHGYGHLKLTQPYRFTIKGEFHEGKLISIEDMWFNDGLHVKGNFVNGKFVSEDWSYLTPQDRRYQAERFYGQQPVGPTSYVTSTLIERAVPKNCYDVEEGIYNAESGWLMERPQPFSKAIYVSCPQEKKWIVRHCRGEQGKNVVEPLPSFCRKIMANNLSTEHSQQKNITIYTPNTRIERERYFPHLCRERKPDQNQTAEMFLQSKRSKSLPMTTTEQCLQAHCLKHKDHAAELAKKWQLQHPGEPVPHISEAHAYTSSSDIPTVDSGATQTCSESKSEVSLVENVQNCYDAAITMSLKEPTDSLYVVQSHMKRPASFVDITHSIFEL